MKLSKQIFSGYALFLCCLTAAVTAVAALLTDGASGSAKAVDVAALTATAGLIILAFRQVKAERRLDELERRAGMNPGPRDEDAGR